MGKGTGSGSGPVDAPNTLQSSSTARIIDLVSEGEIDGIVGGLKGIYLDNTPIQNADGSFNFVNIVVDARAGTPGQSSLPGFPAVEAVFSIGTEIKQTAPVVRAIANANADAALVTIQLNGLQSIDGSTGNIGYWTVQIGIDVQLNGGGWVDVSSSGCVFSGKSSGPYQRSFRIARPGAGTWNIRVRRVTADDHSSVITDQTYWAAVTEIEDYALQYPNSALLAYQVDAQSFNGNIPQRLVNLRGLKTRIPSNYNPITRVYTGVWDGTFIVAWHNNPAWVLYEMIANDRWGIGGFVPEAFRDKWTLYSIGQYCDAMVPDGQGGAGLEPRYAFNFAIASATDALTVLSSIASVFRGMIYWGGAGVTASADMPADPVKLVTPANVIGGLINWGGGSIKARHTAVVVTWYDPSNFCQPAFEVVEGTPADISQFGYRVLQIVAVGCTSRGQAHRMGRWAIETEKSEAQTCGWQASWDHSDVYPGDIVAVQDPAYAGVQFGGRVKALITTTGVTGLQLDRQITLAAGKSYQISVVLSDGTVAVRNVTTAASTTDTLSLDVQLSPAPLVNAIWVITASDLAPILVKVVKRIESAHNTFDLTGIVSDPTKWARIEQNLALEPPNYTALPTGPIVAPTALLASECIVMVSARAHSEVVLSWVLSTDPRAINYQVQVKPPGQNWQAPSPVAFTSSTALDLLDLAAGVWGFRVRSLDAFARSSSWLTLEAATLDGMSLPPADVQNVRASAYVDNNTSISWDEVNDPRGIRYSIRNGSSWSSAIDLGTVAHPPFAAHGGGTYLVKAYTGPDTARIYSLDAAEITITGSTLVANVVATRDEMANGWTGIFGGTAAKSGSLIRTGGSADILSDPDFLNDPDILNRGGQGNGTYQIDPTRYIDCGRVTAARVTCTWQGTSQLVGSNMLTDPDMLNNPDFLGAGSTDKVTVFVEISVAQNALPGDVFDMDPTTNPGNDVFSPSDIFSTDISFGPWVKYEPGVYVGRWFRARLQLQTTDPQVVAIALAFTFTVDVPDRLDTWGLIGGTGTSLNQVTVPSTGLVVVFASNGSSIAEPFNGGPGTDPFPLIQITNTSASAFDFHVTALSASGCTIVPLLAGTPTNAPNTNISIQGW